MSQIRDKYAREIGSAVRAELARRGLSIASLPPLIGLSLTATYQRVRGEQAFDYVEIAAIAAHLGMTTTSLVEQAERSRVAA